MQYNLLFKRARNIENIIPFLKRDIQTYGFFQSMLCSIGLSEFTFASIEVPHQILTMASFTICMNGWAFLFSYFLLYVIINKFCYQRNWGHAVFKGVIQVKADFIIDTKTNRLIYLKAFLATSEVILLWILALASKFFGSLVKQDVAESPEMLTICSVIFLIRPFKLLLHSYVYRRNNFLASCQYGDVEILKKMLLVMKSLCHHQNHLVQHLHQVHPHLHLQCWLP